MHIYSTSLWKSLKVQPAEYNIETSTYKLAAAELSPLHWYKLTTLYLLKQSHTQKNFTCLISIIRSHLNQYIYSQVPVNANIFFTSTALLHSDKCDRYACLMSSSWLGSARDELPERWTLVYLWGYLLFILLQYGFFLRFIFFSFLFSLTDMQGIAPWLLVNWSTCQKKMADPMISFIN